MRLRRYLVGSLTLTLVSVSGGCILDSDDGCGNGNLITGCVYDMAWQPMRGIKIRAFFDPMQGIDPVPDCSTYTTLGGYYQIAYPTGTREVYVYPARDSCVFSPYGKTYNEPTGTLTAQSFVGYCGETYEVSGHIRDDEGHDLASVYVTLKDSDGFWRDDAVTDELGYYVLEGLAPNVEYVVTPSSWCNFEPKSRLYEGVSQDLTDQDFTGTCREMHFVDGYVRDASGRPVERVLIDVLCISPLGGSANSYHGYTDAAGHYRVSLPRMENGGCHILPAKEGCRFWPYIREYGDLEQDLVGQDYTSYCGDGYNIDGHIRTPEGESCEGTYVWLYAPDAFTLREITDSDGYYEFENLIPHLDYRVVPAVEPMPRGGPCVLEPSERSYYDLDEHKLNQDFIQDCPDTAAAD